MAQPPAKKRKHDGTGTSIPAGTVIALPALPPIIFKSPDLKADMRIKIFGQEYHVQSSVLKFHSAYFRRFLDSPEKPQTAVLTAAQFRYEYISIVDDDGEWGLEPASMAVPSTKALKQGLNAAKEQEAFERIFKAMYNIPYDVKSLEELSNLTRLADFYCTLPIVSTSLYRTVFGNRALGRDIRDEPFVALPVAKKLRHPILFREALIHMIGTHDEWDEREKPFSDDDDLNNIAFRALSRLCLMKMKADYHILLRTATNSVFRDVIIDWEVYNGEECGRDYYQTLRNNLKADDAADELLVETIDPLLKSNLAMVELDTGSVLYCANIYDKDMPWDPSQTDW